MTNDLAAPLVTDSLYHEEYRPPFLPVLAILPFLLPVFWVYSVDVTSENLSFGYSWNMARKSVDRSKVSSATAIPHINGLTQWGGWGIRLGLSLKCQTGYIAKNGPGVRISILNEKKNKESIYVFNCEEPDKVCEILNSTKK
jgi:hypothetical protein